MCGGGQHVLCPLKDQVVVAAAMVLPAPPALPLPAPVVVVVVVVVVAAPEGVRLGVERRQEGVAAVWSVGGCWVSGVLSVESVA